jgi:hypothetical protein
MREGALVRVAGILQAIPGVEEVAPLDREQVQRVVELESSHEMNLSLPCRNLGVRLIAARDACFVLLKTGTFRPPGAPSLYLVEEGDPQGNAPALTVAGRHYTIVGEEVTGSVEAYAEPVIPLDGSFVMFPERRRNPTVPCFFLLPPLPFPELEGVRAEMGLQEIMSISPSLASDAWLREAFGFSASNSLATLLVGFDFCSP